jgi:hypothetical protein
LKRSVRHASFEPLGWLTNSEDARLDGACLLLVGNAGPAMFERFAAERNPAHDKMDDWTREVLSPLATQGLGRGPCFRSTSRTRPSCAGRNWLVRDTCLRWASTSGPTLACGMRFARASF